MHTVRQNGLSLIEVMVGMAVAMLASLAVINAFSMSEANKRNTSGAGDAAQSGSMLSYYLSRTLEEAGSGLVNDGILDCPVTITNASTVVFPQAPATPLAAPFDLVPGNLAIAPVIIVDGASATPAVSPASDTIIVSAGRPVGSPQDYPANYVNQLSLTPTPAINFNPGDYLLTYSALTTGLSVPACQIVRVASSFAPGALGTALSGMANAKPIGAAPPSVVTLDAAYGAPVPIDPPAISVRDLGSSPNIEAIARSSSQSLMTVNLLNPTAGFTTITENVVAVRAIYGLDTTGTPKVVDTWVRATGPYAASILLNGTTASASILKQIIALRVAIIVRGSQKATGDAANSSVTLFSDQPTLTVTYPMTGTDANYQYQVYDVVVSLQNPKAL
ncbi:MAG TPA: PilW family protein [Rhodocyclaceae bacterium]|nr:PilW family protein [Rhodocyclaceae bacterium]